MGKKSFFNIFTLIMLVILAFSSTEAFADYVNPIYVSGAYWGTYNIDGNGGFRHDILAPNIYGKPVYAIENGTINCVQIIGTKTNYENKLVSYGNVIYLYASDGKTEARYAHLSSFAKCAADYPETASAGSGSTYTVAGTYRHELGSYPVKKGEVIGYVGSTGNSSASHLHFELWLNGKRVAPDQYISINKDVPPTPDGIPIDETHFPDYYFREYLTRYEKNKGREDSRFNGDGYFSDEELNLMTDMGWHGGPHPDNVNPNAYAGWEPQEVLENNGSIWANIQSIEGIKYFKNLESLYVYNCNIKNIDVSGMTKLGDLRCYGNKITNINAYGCTSLWNLEAQNNELTSITLTDCPNLQKLNVSYNARLTSLYCANCSLTSLLAINCTSLSYINCSGNSNVQLGLKGCSSLETLVRDSSVNVQGSAPVFTTTTLPNAKVNTGYSQYVNATGQTASGTPSVFYRISSMRRTLNLSINKTTGLLSGTPTEAVNDANLTIVAYNYIGSTSKSFPVDVIPAVTPPTITTENIPRAIAGTAYESLFDGFTATGDTPIIWAISDGKLPDGLSLSSSGKITGTPKRVNNGIYTGDKYHIKVTASNNGGSAQAEFDLTLWTPPEITTSNFLKQGYVGEKYSTNFEATGSNYGMVWSIESGALPDGIELDESTVGGHLLGSRQLTITGTPMQAGSYKFILGVAAGGMVLLGFPPHTYEHTTKEFTIEIKNKDIAVNTTNFPDDVFREYISANVDSNKDGFLSDAEIKSRTSLYLGNSSSTSESKKISSLKGIEFLTALTYLDCKYNKLTTIDLSKNTALKTLNCNYNQLKTLDLNKNTELQTLYCNNNQLTGLTLDKNINLNYVDCKENNITTLDVSKTKVTRLYCDMKVTKITAPNGYVAIDAVNFPDAIFRDYVVNSRNSGNFVFSANNGGGITSLYLGNSSSTSESKKISSLKGIEFLTALTYLDCKYNKLTTIDLSNNTALKTVYCNDNQLTKLILGNNNALTTLYCHNNSLKSVNTEGCSNLSTFKHDDFVTPKFTTHALVLSGQIGVIFYVELPEIDGVTYTPENCWMEFDVNGDTTTNEPQYFDPATYDAQYNDYHFVCYVASVQMADPITATLHYGNGQTVTHDYSIDEYFNSILGKTSTSQEMRDLANAMKDYGHYMQNYLARRNNWEIGTRHLAMDYANLYTSDDIAEVKELVKDYAIVRDTGNSGIAKVEFALELDSETIIDVYLIPKQDYTGTVTAYLDGKAVDLEYSNGEYLLKIPGVSAHLLANMYTISVEAGEKFDVKVSALSYVHTILNKENAVLDIKEAVASLYDYYDATMAYRRSKGQ